MIVERDMFKKNNNRYIARVYLIILVILLLKYNSASHSFQGYKNSLSSFFWKLFIISSSFATAYFLIFWIFFGKSLLQCRKEYKTQTLIAWEQSWDHFEILALHRIIHSFSEKQKILFFLFDTLGCEVYPSLSFYTLCISFRW